MTRPRPRPRGPKNPPFLGEIFSGGRWARGMAGFEIGEVFGVQIWVSYICATFFFLKDPTGCQLILGRKSPGGVLG